MAGLVCINVCLIALPSSDGKNFHDIDSATF